MTPLHPLASGSAVPLGPVEPPPPGSDLPAHVLSLARMIARDCSAPGEYTIKLTIPDRPGQPALMQTARLDVIREASAARNYTNKGPWGVPLKPQSPPTKVGE